MTHRRAFYLAMAWAALCTLAANIPYIYGHAIAPPGRVFMGDARCFIDTNSYLAWMHQAADGHVLFKDIYTTEPHARMLFHPLFFVLGNVARFFDLPMATVHSAARVLFGFLLMLALYPFTALFFSRISSRLMAFAVASIAGGFSWLAQVPAVAACDDSWFLTGWVEANTFLSVYALPLFSASVLMMLAIFGLMLIAFERRRLRLAAVAGAVGLILFATHFFDTLIVYPVLLAHAAVAYLVDNDTDALRFRLRALAVFAAVSAASPAFDLYASLANPVFREHAWEAAVTLSPSFWWVLGSFGLLVPLALLGIATVASGQDHPLQANRIFLVVWALSIPPMIYFPLPFQRRLVEGGHVAIAFLAAIGLCRLAARWKLREAVVGAVFIVLAVPALVLYLGKDMQNLRTMSTMQSVAGYLDAAQLDAMTWIGRNSSRDEIVLADYEIGNYVPAVAGNVVYIGHSPETLDFWGKLARVQRFFDASTDDGWRCKFLVDNGIGLIFYSWKERGLGAFDPARAPYLREVHRSGDVSVYRFDPGACR